MHSVAPAHQRFAIMYTVSGRSKDALPHCEATMAQFRTLRQKDRTNVVYIRGMRSAVDIMGSAYARMGDVTRAIPLYREGISCGEELANHGPLEPRSQSGHGNLVHLPGTALAETADQHGARQALEHAAALREPLAHVQPDRGVFRSDLLSIISPRSLVRQAKGLPQCTGFLHQVIRDFRRPEE